MSVTLQLPTDVEMQLRQKAAQAGRSLEAYLEQLAQAAVRAEIGTVSTQMPSPDEIPADEWIAQLRAFAASHRSLPTLADDSRKSIYEGRGE